MSLPLPEEPSRVVLVTGAAGGLGDGLVREFLSQGWRVVAAYHHAKPRFAHQNVKAVELDVTNAAQATTVVKEIVALWGRLDALVNNAGTTADRALWQMREADWDRVLAVNLKGAFYCSQAALVPMLRQRDGHIINISSFSARSGPTGQANYAAAKAGLIGLTQALAKEVGSRNVRVNAVLPGVLPTAMTAALSNKQLDALAAANSLRRLNSIDEIARFVAFLAGMQNVSGQLFQLDSRIAPWT